MMPDTSHALALRGLSLDTGKAEILPRRVPGGAPQAVRTKKIVLLKSSETRENSHSGFALDVIAEALRRGASGGTQLIIKEHNLADGSDAEALAGDFFENDLLVIGTPIRNFSPSLLLQSFFHKLRPKLLTFDANEKLVSRNFAGRNVMVVITGVSGIWKWRLLNQFIFFAHFDLLFDFWGPKHDNNILRVLFHPQNRIRKLFIPNARKRDFEKRKGYIARKAAAFAQQAGITL